MRQTRWGGLAAALFVLTVMGGVAEGAPLVIDDFTSATNTIFITEMNVGVFDPGASTTATDTGLTDVIGGTRELTVHAANTPGFIVGLDNVVVGVVPLVGFLDYNSTAAADGSTVLRYDRGGSGLNASLAPDTGIRLVTLDADIAAVPMQITLTLVDQAAHSVSVTRTVFLAGITSRIDFPFVDFPGVNPKAIFSIEVAIDPNTSGAADLRLDRIETYGSVLTPAPLLSPSMLVALVAALLLCGLRGRVSE
jgi:hypothetical protein